MTDDTVEGLHMLLSCHNVAGSALLTVISNSINQKLKGGFEIAKDIVGLFELYLEPTT